MVSSIKGAAKPTKRRKRSENRPCAIPYIINCYDKAMIKISKATFGLTDSSICPAPYNIFTKKFSAPCDETLVTTEILKKKYFTTNLHSNLNSFKFKLLKM